VPGYRGEGARLGLHLSSRQRSSVPRSRAPLAAAAPSVVPGSLPAAVASGCRTASRKLITCVSQGLLAAHGFTDQGDLAAVYAGLPGQERDSGGDVPVTPPAEVHGVPSRQAVAAAVEQRAP
jgi:hypothetical protein